MSKFLERFVPVALLMSMTLALSGCVNALKPEGTNSKDILDLDKYTLRTKNTTEYFATVSSLRVSSDFSAPAGINRYDKFWEELKDVMEQIEKDVSVSVESSDISRFNMLNYGESISISTHTANIVKIAKEAYESSGGLYDPTVYPLVDLWAFTPRFNSPEYKPQLPYDRNRTEYGFSLPDEKYITEFIKLADFKNVILSGDGGKGYTLTKNIKPVTIDGIIYQAKLDLGGIAKGYAVDVAMEMLKDYEYNYGYFSCGRSSIGVLKSASKKSVENKTFRYNLEIRKPRKGNTEENSFMSAAVRDTGISSSGDYDHAYEIDGTIYSHIIDAKTGFPMNAIHEGAQKGIATVTVFGENATMCDAVSTAICVMDINKALEYVNNNKLNYKVIIVLYNSDYNYYEVLTNLDSDEYIIYDDAYRIASTIDDDGNINYSGTLLK
ncbi:thiamine biosynthesis lipoprotein ApbE precursor [Oxobacter pfennigii]|uniref:FAD:protein FMN transferase n=1 Tax=Oxobacter pfennigii TaxID=36849 RepID=A0A0P8Y969_9CLOT|nr:FAD:protein FMN transferase [Oxobacter pfennigii]KPU43334.1 thiamine biosynthesis lipoprotein ApbE precursor [Oxobacter pfennigii]